MGRWRGGVGEGERGLTRMMSVRWHLLALAFEFVNGFHDTANAVATVIYTNTLKATPAVVWSGVWNLIGVLTSSAPTSEDKFGTAVAISPFAVSSTQSTNILSVSTHTSIFTYFETKLYPDVRTGRSTAP